MKKIFFALLLIAATSCKSKQDKIDDLYDELFENSMTWHRVFSHALHYHTMKYQADISGDTLLSKIYKQNEDDYYARAKSIQHRNDSLRNLIIELKK